MKRSFETFLSLSDQIRLDVYQTTANRLETMPNYVEKDVWVCLILDALFNRLPVGHPNLLFKGGTSLSKAFGLINRFSEDVDITVYRDSLGYNGERDPTIPSDLSRNKRNALFDELRASCSRYICEDLRSSLEGLLRDIVDECRIVPDDNDKSEQSLLVEYPTLYPENTDDYVMPAVKLEAGARSALSPSLTCSIKPYISYELTEFLFDVGGIKVFAPERTYLDKLLILHGLHCGYRDEQRLPKERNRISRHYYDVAKITDTKVGISALSNVNLLDDVRNHNLIAFRQRWKRIEEAVPGTMRLIPQPELRKVIESDYQIMQFMFFDEIPDFGWIMEQIEYAEVAINRA